MQSESKIHCSQLEGDAFNHSSNLSGDSSSFYMDSLEWKRSSENKSRSDSESSFKSLRSNQQFRCSNINLDEDEIGSRKVLDDEDCSLDDTDAEEDDDGIVLDCEDDRDSLSDAEQLSYGFLKNHDHSDDYLLSYNQLNPNTSHFGSNYPLFNHHSNYCNKNQQLAQTMSRNMDFNPTSHKLGSHFESKDLNAPGEDSNKSITMEINQHAEEKQKLLRILKENDKLKAEILTCNGCGQMILDRCLLKVAEQPWHSECLKCAVCGIHLDQSCFLRSNKAYCKDDFKKKFKSKCSTCDQPIPPTEVVRKAGDNVYHMDCFFCYMCKQKLDTGDSFYLVNDHKLMCKKDFEEEREQRRRALELDNNSKRPRTTINAKQLDILRNAYILSSKPARHIREQLSQETGLELRVVQVWFQNKRAKDKRQKKEIDSKGKYFGPYQGSGVALGSLDHELNSRMSKRSGRSGHGGSRKKSTTSSGRLHPRLPTPLQPNGILNQPFHLGNINENCFGVPGINLGGPVPLHFIPGPCEVSPTFSQQIHDRLTNPAIKLENPLAFPYDFSESSHSVAPGLPLANAYTYSSPENLLKIRPRVEDVPLLSEMSNSKIELNFSTPVAECGKDSNPHPFSLSAPDFSNDRFLNVCGQPNFSRSCFSNSGDTSVTVLNDIPSTNGTWLNEQPAAQM